MGAKPRAAKSGRAGTKTGTGKQKGGRKARGKPPIGCLIWFTLMLVLAVAFLAARPSIARAIHESGLAGLVGGKRAASDAPEASSPAPSAVPDAAGPADSAPVAGAPRSPASPAPAAAAGPAPAPAPAARSTERVEQRAAQAPSPAPVAGERRRESPSPTAEPVRRRRSTLYFVKVSEEGTISVSGLPRSVTYTDAPLTDTLAALVEGPTASESGQGYRSLIPSGTRLESVRVEGRIAVVSFSESFRFNSYGKAGLVGQLEQVVYTATEFPNVDGVQILIGGKATDYLGPEGVRIREPLSRESFAKGGP